MHDKAEVSIEPDPAVTSRGHRHGLRKVIIGASVGNIVEWFDYTAFALVAVIFATQYFSAGDATVSRIFTLGVYALGILSATLVSPIVGRWADTWGRRRTLAVSILAMSARTVLIGLTPTFDQIGMWAPILITVWRLVQSVGGSGEYTAAVTFVREHGPAHQRNRLAGLVGAGVYVGIVLATGLATLLSATMTEAAFGAWGWRILFLTAAPLAIVGVYIRTRLDETPEFKAVRTMQLEQRVKPRPVTETFRDHWRKMLALVGLALGQRAGAYVLTGYLVTALLDAGFAQGSAFGLSTIANVLLIVFILLAGELADRIGEKKILIVGFALNLLLTVPIFLMIERGTRPIALLALLLYLSAKSLITPSLSTVVVTSFPPHIRGTGSSVSLNASTSLVGGTAPLVATWLYGMTGSNVVWRRQPAPGTGCRAGAPG
jgi:MHS family proline/betaine transporter-like MFS transporter